MSQLVMTRLFNAPISKVWDAWTNPQSIKQWKAPDGMTTPQVSVDLRVGGAYQIVMEGQPAGTDKTVKNVVNGHYQEIDMPTKLVYTWLWQGAPAETHTTTVTILLKELQPHQTELTLIHSGFVDDHMNKEHEIGWISTLQKLDTFVS